MLEFDIIHTLFTTIEMTLFMRRDTIYSTWWRIDPNQGWRHMLKKTKHV